MLKRQCGRIVTLWSNAGERGHSVGFNLDRMIDVPGGGMFVIIGPLVGNRAYEGQSTRSGRDELAPRMEFRILAVLVDRGISSRGGRHALVVSVIGV